MRKRQDHLFAYISATLYAAIVSMSFLTVKIGLVSANPFELLPTDSLLHSLQLC